MEEVVFAVVIIREFYWIQNYNVRMDTHALPIKQCAAVRTKFALTSAPPHSHCISDSLPYPKAALKENSIVY